MVVAVHIKHLYKINLTRDGIINGDNLVTSQRVEGIEVVDVVAAVGHG